MKWFVAGLILISSSLNFASDFEKSERDFEKVISQSCEVNLKFDLHDYEYGTDESSLYSNRHFEDCSMLKHLIAKACERHPKNKNAVVKIKRVVCQRGNKGEGRLIFRKNGDLTFLIDSNPEREKLLTSMLKKTVGVDVEADYKKELAIQAESKNKKEREDRENKLKIKTEERNKKISELTAWFQTEVQKITKNLTPDMSQKLEKLTKSYEEKLNAIQSTP